MQSTLNPISLRMMRSVKRIFILLQVNLNLKIFQTFNKSVLKQNTYFGIMAHDDINEIETVRLIERTGIG